MAFYVQCHFRTWAVMILHNFLSFATFCKIIAFTTIPNSCPSPVTEALYEGNSLISTVLLAFNIAFYCQFRQNIISYMPLKY